MCLAWLALALPLALRAQSAGPDRSPPPKRLWLDTPAVQGRLLANHLGLVINLDDPYSVAVGRHYAERRGLAPAQVLQLHFAVKPVLTPAEFAPLRAAIQRHFGANIQGLALAWRMPWAVACNGITSAVSLGYRPAQCMNTCAEGERSPVFNQASAAPYAQYGVRPSMLIAATDVAQAERLIDRGVAADGQFGRRFSMRTLAVFASTDDPLRSVRSALFPPSMDIKSVGVELREEFHAQAQTRRERGEHLIFFETGAVSVGGLDSFQFVPGAVADHLTSSAGVLDGSGGQMPATAWIDAGATASYGTVSEPCNHAQKFPHPQLLLQYLLKGSTVMEAYWRSVAWPTQGVFIGEPLAAPFGR